MPRKGNLYSVGAVASSMIDIIQILRPGVINSYTWPTATLQGSWAPGEL